MTCNVCGRDLTAAPPSGWLCHPYDLYRPTLDSLDDVRAWFAAWDERGGIPHPDDSAWLTCEQEIKLGFAALHASHVSHDEGGHLALVGPAAPRTREDALAYDAAMDRAHEIANAAGLDICEIAYQVSSTDQEGHR